MALTGYGGQSDAADVSEDMQRLTLSSVNIAQDKPSVEQLYFALQSPTAIRLLALQPGEGDEVVVCRLLEADLGNEHCIDFEALSYVWGDPKSRSAITVNEKRFDATLNLVSALKHLRSASGSVPRILWVDAICINQADLDERGQQVQLMTQLYQRAERVLAWTGEEGMEGYFVHDLCNDVVALSSTPKSETVARRLQPMPEDTSTATERMKLVRKAIDLGWKADDTDREGPRRFLTEEEWERLLYDDNEDIEIVDGGSALPHQFRALDRLFRRPWFRRIWIVQEATVPKNLVVYMGKYCVQWDLLMLAKWSCQELARFPVSLSTYKPILTLSGVRDRFHAQKQGLDLLNLLVIFRDFQATVLHDKIYALLGIATPAIGIKPNYKMEVHLCFQLATVSCLEARKNLDPLCISLRTCRRNDTLPSWVPDWSDSGPHPRSILAWSDIEELGLDKPKHEFAATKRSRMPAIVVSDLNQLKLQGYVFDRILQLTGTLSGAGVAAVDKQSLSEDSSDMAESVAAKLAAKLEIALACRTSFQELVSWYDFAGVADRGIEPYQFTTGQTIMEAFMRTVCLDHPWIGFDKARVAINDFGTCMHRSEVESYLQLERNDEETSLMYFLRLEEACAPIIQQTKGFSHIVYPSFYRRFAITESGRFAVVPQQTKIDDQLMLLQGGNVPFVMRRHSISDVHWEMIGDAYVHGAMDGELWYPAYCKDVFVV